MKTLFFILLAASLHGATRQQQFDLMVLRAESAADSWRFDTASDAKFLSAYTALRGCAHMALTEQKRAEWAYKLAVLCEEYGDIPEAMLFYRAAVRCADKALLTADGRKYKALAAARIAELE